MLVLWDYTLLIAINNIIKKKIPPFFNYIFITITLAVDIFLPWILFCNTYALNLMSAITNVMI